MLNLNYKLFLLIFAMAIGIGFFGVAGEVRAEYYSAGTSTSANLLSGMTVPSIDNFYYNITSLPTSTSIKFRYSTTSTSGPWVNSAGTPNGWDTATTTGGATTSLSSLNWSGGAFYYQARFESDPSGSSTPVLTMIKLEYSNPAPNAPYNPSPSHNETDVTLPPTLSVDVFDDDGDAMTVYFYDNSDDSLIGTTSIAATSPVATTTATTSWSGLATSTTYSWYAKANDGQATSATSSVWSFTTFAPPPPPSNLSQYEGDCTTTIGIASSTYSNSVCFKAQIVTRGSYQVKLQVDYSNTGSLDGVPDGTSSSWQSSTSTVSITETSLALGKDYKWQVRTIIDGGATTTWTQFNSGDTAFSINLPPAPMALKQYEGDCTTPIATSSYIDTTSVCFKAQIVPKSDYQVKLQLDYSTSTLDGVPDATSSSWQSSTSTVSITGTGLAIGEDYKWQVRTITDCGATTTWTQFNSGDVAFGLKYYETAGTSTSANLLSGLDVYGIRTFYYSVSSLPASTTLKFRYSTTSASGPWVNSAGTPNAWDTVASAGAATTSLTDFNWSECPFYYQARFESDPEGQYSPVLDLIKLRFFPPNPFTIEGEVIFNNIDIKTVLPEGP